jgi:hypothetical protein
VAIGLPGKKMAICPKKSAGRRRFRSLSLSSTVGSEYSGVMIVALRRRARCPIPGPSRSGGLIESALSARNRASCFCDREGVS